MHRLVLALVLVHSAWAAPMKVAVFVALCDNATQGIQPVPKAIGDGDKPEANLYWGCTEGFGGCFRTSKTWKLQKKETVDDKRIFERVVYPGAFILRDALPVWAKHGSFEEIRAAGAAANAKNQKISLKAAKGVFAVLP